EVELLAQDLVLGLREQHVALVVLAEHLVEEASRLLQLARALRLPGEALADQAAHARDLAEAPPRELARVEAGEHVVEHVAFLEKDLIDERRRVERAARR